MLAVFSLLLLNIQVSKANSCFELATAILTQSSVESSSLRSQLSIGIAKLSRSQRKSKQLEVLLAQFESQKSSFQKLASEWNIEPQQAFFEFSLHSKKSLEEVLATGKVSKELIDKIADQSGLSRQQIFQLWLVVREQNFSELTEFFPKLKTSAELFDLSPSEFIKRLSQSKFTAKEYYQRVLLLRSRVPLWKEPRRIFKGIAELHQATVDLFSRNFDKYLNLSKDFAQLKVLLKGAQTNSERGLIAAKYALTLPPKKIKMLYLQILESFAKAKTKLVRKVIQTRLINMPDFKKVVATSLIADNGSMAIMHGLKHGLERLSSLSTDLGAFSVIEVILSMTTIKEAAFLEAFPKLLKNGKEAAAKLTAEELAQLKQIKTPLQKVGNFLSKALKLSKSEGKILVKDGAGLGVKTSLISILPVAVGFAATGMTGAHLLTETLMMSGLIGVFFSTSSNLRYQILNRLLVPMLRKSPKLAKNESLRTSLILGFSAINVAVGSYTWLWYKEKYEEARGQESEAESE